MTGREHARLLGLLFWIFTGIQVLLIGALGIIWVVFFSVIFSTVPHNANDPSPAVFLPFLIVIMAIILVSTLLFSIPKLIAGYGLRNEKSWARVWAIIACCMAVMSPPLGTALGVYGLIFLFGDDGKRYFEGPEYGRIPVGSNANFAPPQPNSWQ